MVTFRASTRLRPWALAVFVFATAGCTDSGVTESNAGTGSETTIVDAAPTVTVGAPAAATVPAGAADAEVAEDAADETRPDGPVVPILSTGDDELRDLLRPGDPAAAYCIADLGVGPGEFYDKDADELVFPDSTSFFEARYDDGSTVEIRIHPDLIDDNGMAQADRIAQPISLLPVELRRQIERVGFLDGESTAQADGGGEGIHVYAGNVTIREQANRFEETIFHESVHTSLDDRYRDADAWIAAQQADNGFLTEYAANNATSEDLAETALYAWALTHHPRRISEADAAAWASLVPARIAFVNTILSPPGSGYSPAEQFC